MKKAIFLLVVCFVLSSHDMFLKLDSYFLEPDKPALIKLYNGTFDKSDNVIDRNRMADVSLVGGGVRTAVDTALWSEKDSMTLLNFNTKGEGTWIAGVSIKPKLIEMKADEFNEYLVHDGVSDMLKWRKENNALDKDAIEQYSKHVKTIFQVGDHTTSDYKTSLGYPLEFIPLENPYEMHPGHDLKIKLLWQGQPLTNQLVYIGNKESAEDQAHKHNHEDDQAHDHSHGDGDDHTHDLSGGLLTDSAGIVSVPIDKKGIHYLRTIHLINSDKEGLTHESNWATLTFEIGDGHMHSHEHSSLGHSNDGLPSYVYVIAGLALIGGLFFWFSREKR